MLSRMHGKLPVAALLCLVWAGAANAVVQCPASSGGHPLRALGGGRLYEGPLQDNAALAPGRTQQGPDGWVNTWTFRGSADAVTLVCRYEGTQTPEVRRLTREITICRQDARSFVCQ